jgi:hypothetical protein
MTKRDMIADFLSVKQLSNMFCEDGVLEAAACAVVLQEIGRNKEKRNKPRKKRVTKKKKRINQLLQIISFFTPSSKSLEDLWYSALNLSTHCTIKISIIFSTFSIMFLN